MVKKISAEAGSDAPAADPKSGSTSARAGKGASRGGAGLGGAAAALQGLQGLQSLFDKQLSGAVKDSAQQIWLAGMGAFAKAQAEGGKVFEALVKEGLSLQKKTQNMAEEKISEVTGKMTAMAGSVSAKAGENWDKLESIFEARTAKAMNKLGVPTAKDLDALAQRVDELAAAVARLSKSQGAAKAGRTATPAKAEKTVKAAKAANSNPSAAKTTRRAPRKASAA